MASPQQSPTSTPQQQRRDSQLPPADKFFRYFQQQVTALQAQFARLETQSTTGGERSDAIDHCLAGIARLSDEVQDAAAFLPAYDQRTYGEAVKALSAKLAEVRAGLAPRRKFGFKNGRLGGGAMFTAQKNESAMSLSDAAELAAQGGGRGGGRERRFGGVGGSEGEGSGSEFATTPDDREVEKGEAEAEDGEEQRYSTMELKTGRQPSFSQSKSVNLSNHDGVHIILPVSAGQATSSGTLSLIHRCVVDMSSPTKTIQPFATLTLKHIRDSLIVCGHVSGAAHLTKITNSVIVVASRQFRMHESKDCTIYLRTSSRPIIEDCSGIRFAPLPEVYELEGEAGENQWDQVDDFKWLRSEASPNWRALGVEERLGERVWREVVPGGGGRGVEDVLREVGVMKVK